MNELHPAAPHHLPSYITPPGETDVLMVVTGVILLLSVLMFGSIFFRLHTMPERMAHRGHKLQFEIVAVLGLLALFTHIHLFWVAGLLLALIDIPDFGGSLSRIAGSTEKTRRDWSRAKVPWICRRKHPLPSCEVIARPPWRHHRSSLRKAPGASPCLNFSSVLC